MKDQYENRYQEAKKRVHELKGFYTHLAVYLIVNLIISGGKIIRNLSEGENFKEAFWDAGTFAIWILWGVGLAFHAHGIFVKSSIFGSAWEERKIAEYMNEETESYRRNQQRWE